VAGLLQRPELSPRLPCAGPARALDQAAL